MRFFIRKIQDENERRIARGKLTNMIDFAESRDCRRRRILAYFGERYPLDDCGMCDVCVKRTRMRTDGHGDRPGLAVGTRYMKPAGRLLSACAMRDTIGTTWKGGPCKAY